MLSPKLMVTLSIATTLLLWIGDAFASVPIIAVFTQGHSCENTLMLIKSIKNKRFVFILLILKRTILHFILAVWSDRITYNSFMPLTLSCQSLYFLHY